MNKSELITAIATDTGMTKTDAAKAVNSAFTAIADALANGEKVQILGFGAFDVREKPEHESRNPRTKETIIVPASRKVVFKAGKTLKDRL